MIRPWYRSRLFWLGLPGLAFLLWLWLAKARTDLFFGHTQITGFARATTRGIGACDGSIYYSVSKVRTGVSGPDEYDFHGLSEDFEPDEPAIYFPRRPFAIVRETNDLHAYREIWLAWWAVISAYLVTWLGTLALWQRRKSRLSKTPAVPLS